MKPGGPQKSGQGHGLTGDEDMNGLREAWLHSPLTSCAHHLTGLNSPSVKWGCYVSQHVVLWRISENACVGGLLV